MESLVCKNCGSTVLHLEKEFWVCDFCGSKYLPPKQEQATGSGEFKSGSLSSSRSHFAATSTIALSDDVERLLQKCRSDRKNARKYANLILDIDPDNTEALKYLK